VVVLEILRGISLLGIEGMARFRAFSFRAWKLKIQGACSSWKWKAPPISLSVFLLM
jgi:hypothetical protein